MVVNPLDVEVDGLDKAKDFIYSELDLYKERSGISPISFDAEIEVISDSPYSLPNKLRNQDIVLTVWIEPDGDIDIPDKYEKTSGEKTYKQTRKEGFQEIGLNQISLNIEEFDETAELLDNISENLKSEGYKIQYFGLKGHVEEDSFKLTIERLKNRIFPMVRVTDSSGIKINLQYEPSLDEKQEYIFRPIVAETKNQYNTEKIEKAKKELMNILKNQNIPTKPS